MFVNDIAVVGLCTLYGEILARSALEVLLQAVTLLQKKLKAKFFIVAPCILYFIQLHTHTPTHAHICVKVNQSHLRPGQAQRFPGS